MSALDSALGQVNSLRDKLDGLLEQLEKMRSALKGHEPPHVVPADVENQIKEIMVRLLQLELSISNTHTYAKGEGIAQSERATVGLT